MKPGYSLEKGKDMTGRIEQLRAKLTARIDGTGKPYPGYAQNVEAIRREIEKLEERSTYAGVEWPE